MHSLNLLEGGEALLSSGASAEEVSQAYSRLAITLAMGRVRARILREGLCGVPHNASFCVGSWCHPRGDAAIWGVAPAGTAAAVVGAESDGPHSSP